MWIIRLPSTLFIKFSSWGKTMCDCVPSSPLSHFNFTAHTDWKIRSKPSHLCNSFHFPTKHDHFHLLITNFSPIISKSDKSEPNSRINVVPESYNEVFDELGLKEEEEKGNNSFEFEKRGNEENEESISLRLDVMELTGDLYKKTSDGRVENEEKDEIQKFVGRKGRQVIRRSNVLAKQVVSVESALSVGFVTQLWVDTCSWIVLVVEVRPSMLSGEMERFLMEDVYQVGDFVLVEDESVLENDVKMVGLDTLVGYNVVTPSRRSIGKVRGYTFNINSGVVELLELDSFGISVIPSSLVSTYGLLVEDVVSVESDTVVVHEAAASRVQRLTKGFWDTPNVGTSAEEVEEYPDLERQPTRSNRRRSTRKFTSKMRETEDDWQLPMDYL